MKKILFSLLMVAFVTQGVMAQHKRNVIKLNPLSGLLSTANVSYEKPVSAKSSFQFGFFYSGIKISETRYAGFGITPEYRFYLGYSNAPEGIYVAPFLRYQNFSLKETESNAKGTLTTMGGGLVIGKHWIFDNSFSVDLFIGPSYNAGDAKAKNENETFEVDNAFSGFGVRTGVTIGFAF